MKHIIFCSSVNNAVSEHGQRSIPV